VPADTKIKNQQLTAISGTGASTEASTCFANLVFGSYYVHESSAPTGYSGAADQTASISTNSTCASSPVTKTFTDTPLSKITVSFESLGAGNPTSATIVCTASAGGSSDGNAALQNLPEGTPLTIGNGTSGLTPGTYTCAVVVDP
jgi:hypothetical protein